MYNIGIEPKLTNKKHFSTRRFRLLYFLLVTIFFILTIPFKYADDINKININLENVSSFISIIDIEYKGNKTPQQIIDAVDKILTQ